MQGGWRKSFNVRRSIAGSAPLVRPLVLCVILGYSILALIRYGYKRGPITAVAEISSAAISVLMRIFRITAMSISPPVTNYKNVPTLSSLL